jgi:hypothetical protein
LLGAFEEFSLFPEGNPLHLKLLLAKAFNDLRFFEMSVQMTKTSSRPKKNTAMRGLFWGTATFRSDDTTWR